MRVQAADSAALLRWDPGSIFRRASGGGSAASNAEVKTMGELVTRRWETNTEEDVRLGSIHFDGSLSLRPLGRRLKGASYLAHSGDIVFSRIDFRNGAITVVPGDVQVVAFSNEYPIYSVREHGRLLAEYLRLIFRTATFRNLAQSLSVGHTGRRRVSADAFESVRIPVPEIPEQRRLVNLLDVARIEAQRLRRLAVEMRTAFAEEVANQLGISEPEDQREAQPRAVPSHWLDRWMPDVRPIPEGRGQQQVKSCYPVRPLGDPHLAEVSYGLQKSPRNRPGADARPYLRVANVQDGFLDLREIKTIDVPSDQLEMFRLEPGDLLLCEGNSADLVGRPAIWQGEIENCVHQNHVLRVRTRREELDPEYVLSYMQTGPSRQHFRKRAKQTTNLATINSADVRELPVPVPPMRLQKQIAAKWRSVTEEVERSISHADRLESTAAAEVDSEIERLMIL